MAKKQKTKTKAKKPSAKKGAVKALKTVSRTAAKAFAAGKKKKAIAADLIRVIPAASLKSLESELKTLRTKKDGAAEAVKKRIQKASSTQHLNKEAFTLYEKWKKKDDKKLAVIMAHFEHLCEVGGLNKRATAQGELFARPEIGEKEPAKAAAPKVPSASAGAPKEIPFESPGGGTRSLVRPSLVPSPAVVKDIADRAAAGSKH